MPQLRRFSRPAAVIAVLFSTLTPALAQSVVCVAFVANQPALRQEGVAEPAGDIILSCTQNYAGSQFAGPQTLSLYLTGTTIASRELYSGAPAPSAIPTEAALLINDCTSSSGTSPTTGTPCSASTIPAQGTLQDGALVFTGFTLPLSTGSTFPWMFQIRITNVRVNANAVPTGTFIFGTVLATFPIQNQSGLVMGVVQSSLLVGNSQESSLNGCAASESPVSGLTVGELVQTAFKSPALSAANAIPGGWYQNNVNTNTESQTILSPTPAGWTNQLTGILPGQADHATRIRVNLSGIPAGVTVLLPANLTSTSGTGTLAATSGGDLGAFAAVTGSQIPITSSGSVTYEVRSQSAENIDSFPFAITVSSAGNVGPGPILESVTYAPTTLENSTDIPTFADTSVPTPIAIFSSCLQPTRLVFTQQPFRGPVLSAISPVVVQVEDGLGNLIATSNAAITVASSPSGVSQTVNAVNGIATFSNLIFNTPGTYALLASAGGIGGGSSGSILIVGQATTTTLDSSANPETYGQVITLTANVSPSNATGSVTFYDGVAMLGTRPLVSGRAVLTTNLLASGKRSLTALYSGDATYAPGKSAALPQTVSPVLAGAFTSPTDYAAGIPTVADFNGDGKADLIAAGGNFVNVLLGNGDGTFRAAITTATAGLFSGTLAVGDFNGDGKTDVVVLNGGDSSFAGGNTMSVLLGNGDGTFQTAINTSLGNNPISVLVGDFNGDGKADIAVGATTNQVSYSLNVYLGNGDGTFQPPVSYILASALYSAALGDFNGDGIPDIVAATSTGISVLLGNGDGSFQLPLNYTVGTGASSIAVGDFNNDGKADVVIGNCCATGTGITVLLGNGNGTFQAAGGYYTPGPTPVTVADINGDGYLDIVAVTAGALSVFLGNGNGTFQAVENYTGGVFSSAAAVADFNGDGRADMAVTNLSSVAVFLGTTPAPPTLSIAKSHTGNFTQGQTNAVYTVTVSSAASAGSMIRASESQSGSAVTLTSLSASTLTAGVTSTLYLYGTNFTPNTVAYFNGNALSTTYVDSTTLYATVPAADAIAGALPVYVSDPVNGTSATLYITVESSGGPITLTSLSSSSLSVGVTSTLYLFGTNFTPSTVVHFNGNLLVPTYIASTELYVVVPPVYATAGTLPVYVTDPANGTSSILYVTVGSSGGPTLTSISPSSAPVGSPALTLTVTGTGFTAGAVLNFGTVCAVATTLISSSELTAILPANCFTAPGNFNVTVANSNALPFTVGSPIVGIIPLSSVLPSTLTVGMATTLQLTGANFTPATIVYFNNTGFISTYISSTLIEASVPAAYVTTGSLPVYVRDPTNGISNVLYVTVTGPTVTVTETVPTGMTLVSMSGTGWTCPSGANICTRSDTLAAGASYPAITVTVNVAANAPASLTNQVSVTSGGSAPATASDTTTILQLPAAPVLTSPANLASGVAINPTLTWSASNGATSYDVYFGAASSPPFAANVSGTSYSPTPAMTTLSAGTTYYWQVVAKNSAGNVASAVWSFTTTTAPAIAKAFNPTSIQLGGSSVVTVTLANSNPSTLTGGAFTDTLVNMTAAGGPVAGTCAGTAPSSLTAGQTALGFNGIILPAGSSCTVTFSVTSSTQGAHPNTTSGLTTTQTPAAGAVSNTATLTVLGPGSIAASAGTPQNATIDTAFANPLLVTVKDTNGNPLSGIVVTFSAPTSGASASLSSTTATTDSSGQASVTATANGTAGSYSVGATVSGISTPATFSLTNTAGTATNLSASGTPQSATVNTAFSTALQVTVKDAGNNPVSGATVIFTVPTAGASATLSSNSATTNSSGQASITATANTVAGAYTMTAAVGADNAAFNLTNLAGPAASILASAGTPQSTLIGTAFATALQATVKDSFGNPVSGVSVTFSTPSTGASASFTGSATVTTNSSGIATAPALTANSTSGSYSATATAGSLNTTFSLTNAADLLVFTTQPPNGTAGVALAPFTVQVQDPHGNLVTGSTAAITVNSTPPGASATVNAVNGTASFTAVEFDTPGTYTLTATSPNLVSAVSSAIVIAPAPVVPQYPVKPPAVFIDLPTGSVIPGLTNLTGGAVGGANGPIKNVSVSMDGVVLGQANYGLYRPDLPCAGLPVSPGCPDIGFSYAMDTASLAAGPHTVTVSATDQWGNEATASIQVSIAAGPIHLSIESPAAGAIVNGQVPITGWAIDTSKGAISALEVKIDGVVAGNATYGASRPDVCAAYPSGTGCPNVGFTYQLDSFAWTPGTHVITLSAVDALGNTGSASTTVTVPVASPIVYLESPLTGSILSGSVTLEGWALSASTSNGAAVSGIQVQADGVTIGTATMGVARRDVCTANPGRAACPNVGFTYQLDTAKLKPGFHMLTVQATDSAGNAQAGSWSARLFTLGQ